MPGFQIWEQRYENGRTSLAVCKAAKQRYENGRTSLTVRIAAKPSALQDVSLRREGFWNDGSNVALYEQRLPRQCDVSGFE